MTSRGHHMTNVRHEFIARDGLLMRPPHKEYDYCKDGVYLFTVATTAWGWNFPSGNWHDIAAREYDLVCVVDYAGLESEIDELIYDNEAVRVLADIESGRIEIMEYEAWELRFLPEVTQLRLTAA